MSYVLGITGGIASGKSTVVNVFRSAGFPIVDGDVVAREVVEPGTPGLFALVEAFGEMIITPKGTLNRRKLGNLIFRDEEERKKLNRTLEPFIRNEIDRQIEVARKSNSLVIADIPLLYEGHYENQMDAIAVVYIDHATQLRRLMVRNQLSEMEAMNRINSQMPLNEKKQLADVIFDNSGTLEETADQVIKWLKKQAFIE
ncbi:dephospho-CoA kinase [Enterococcus sp. AZ072]|uniref:dephospho-CoA kinase n=1 Tax=unclassified Enterococcus TaxID=2608891 RepID=UPI003D2C6229